MRIVAESLKYLFPGCRVSEMGRLFRVWAGSSLALAAIALLDRHVGSPVGLPLLIGSFGASAVLVFGAPTSPLARARNVLGGHVLSALTGVICAMSLGDMPWLASGLAVGTAILLMSATGTLHPPGGATALIAVTGGESIRQLGFLYVVVPCLTGALFLLGCSLLLSVLDEWGRLTGVCLIRNREALAQPRRLKRRVVLLRQLRRLQTF